MRYAEDWESMTRIYQGSAGTTEDIRPGSLEESLGPLIPGDLTPCIYGPCVVYLSARLQCTIPE